jgi:hypothetical protein
MGKPKAAFGAVRVFVIVIDMTVVAAVAGGPYLDTVLGGRSAK